MLRAVIWKGDIDIQQGRKTLETGHDLQRLLSLAGNLGLLRSGEHDYDFHQEVQLVARLWSNDFRFASTRFIESRWRALRSVTPRQSFGAAVEKYFRDCTAIIKRCELLWQR